MKAKTEAIAQGAKWSFAPGCRIGGWLIKRGVYEPEETKLIQRILEPGDVFVDIGAHIGYHTVLAARRVGAQGLTVAFEADPDTYTYLAKNLTQNSLARGAAIFNLAILDHAGITTLHRDLRNPSDNRCYDAKDGRPKLLIGASTLDAILAPIFEPRKLRAKLIKIDTQGSELEVLAGAGWAIKDHPDLLIEWWPKGLLLAGHHPEDLWNRLTDLGYELLLPGNGPASKRALLDLARIAPEAHCNLHARRRPK